MPIRYSKTSLFLFFLLLIALGSGSAPASAQSAPELLVQVSADDNSFASSQAVLVRVVFTNPTDKDIHVLSWHTPANGVLEPLFIVTYDGVSVDYLGALYKRPNPTEQDYITVAAGKSLEYIVDLSQYYSFAKSGTYKIEYNTGSENLYSPNVSGRLVSNSILLDVVGRSDPLKKVIQPQVVTGNTTFNACSVSQQTALITARNDAGTYANTAKIYFNNNRAGALYQLWFGVFNATRHALVKNHFNLISNAADTATINFDCGCTDPYYAYVFPSSPYNIYLCTYFWGAPATGTDSKAGTLIHEMSHFTVLGGTDDFVYGQTGAKALAINNPAQAVMNADNHEYFAENTPITADNAAAYTLSETSFNFGSQPSGTSSSAHSFTITNRGDINLSVGQLSVSTQFTLLSDACSNTAVDAGGTCTFNIAFAPTSTGSKVGTVTIPSNATIATSISLSGTGTAVVTQAISGSTGVSGVVLSYTDGSPKTATSTANGNYSLNVTNGWSGTVTPSHPCYTFSPASYSYTNVTNAQPNKNYAPTFISVNNCADINIGIGGTNQGTYTLSPGTSQVLKYALDGGPVVIGSGGGPDILASLNQWRRRPSTTVGWTGVAQTMALPVSQITNAYYFPRYDYSAPNALYNNLLIANVDTVSRDITITIGGVVRGTYTLGPSQSQYVNYPGVVGGPVVVSSVSGAKIVASLYELIRDPSLPGWNGQSEMIGLPATQLSDQYLIPLYFGAANPNTLNASLYIANVTSGSTSVEVRIAGVLRGTYPLAANTGQVVKYALDGGPVEIRSTNGANIVASLNQWRRRPSTTVGWTGVAQTMALPVSLITDTYYFPRYDYSAPSALYNNLLIANVDTVSRDITITIGGVVRGTYTLAPSQSQYVNYPGLVGGPVVVSSVPGAKIVASLYELIRDPILPGWNGQSEMMGLPASQLSDQYLIPLYFGAANPNTLNASLYIAVP